MRPGDAVILLHVSPTSVLFGADWGSIDVSITDPIPSSDENAVNNNEQSKRKLEDDFDAFTASKVAEISKPLKDAQIPFKIHIVKDHDMRERLCLEVERMGLSAVIMGSRGFGAARRGSDGRLGSVSDYCVHHCVCPVVVVRYPDDKDSGIGGRKDASAVAAVKVEEKGEAVIKSVEQQHKKEENLHQNPQRNSFASASTPNKNRQKRNSREQGTAPPAEAESVGGSELGTRGFPWSGRLTNTA
ncbi:universal stress protein PHOS32-like [Senna tora]|uniref:Universal stress protein PHOS32-like n=1 Tax=Senna tora TaxID=362788 RepID=A0A835CBF5_9FABA|nr:universal stress protein PHOS32-like [Senna tora]